VTLQNGAHEFANRRTVIDNENASCHPDGS
jgi:hypothetical protein